MRPSPRLRGRGGTAGARRCLSPAGSSSPCRPCGCTRSPASPSATAASRTPPPASPRPCAMPCTRPWVPSPAPCASRAAAEVRQQWRSPNVPKRSAPSGLLRADFLWAARQKSRKIKMEMRTGESGGGKDKNRGNASDIHKLQRFSLYVFSFEYIFDPLYT